MVTYVLHLIGNATLFAVCSTMMMVCLYIAYARIRKYPIDKKRLLVLTSSLLYFSALYHITIIRNGIVWERIATGSFSSIQWIPMVELISILHNSIPTFLYNVIGNLIWFVPLGYLGSYIHSEYCLWKAVRLGSLVSLSIECLQFLFVNGISDIDDILLNTLGTMLGYGLWKLYQNIKMHTSTTKQPM